MLSVGTTALLLVPQLFADRERSVAAIYVILRRSERIYSFATLQSSRSRRSAGDGAIINKHAGGLGREGVVPSGSARPTALDSQKPD